LKLASALMSIKNSVLTKKASYIIYEQIDPWLFQSPEKTKDQIFESMLFDMQEGRAVPIEKDGFIFYIVPETKWLVRVHMFSKAVSSITALKASMFLTDFVFDNTKINKMYGITPLRSMLKVSERVGWKHEGTLTQSFMSENGYYKDQHIFGVTREQNKKWRNK